MMACYAESGLPAFKICRATLKHRGGILHNSVLDLSERIAG